MEKKKLTEKQKQDLKQKLKKTFVRGLTIISFILNFLFIGALIIGGCAPMQQSTSNQQQQNNVIERLKEPNYLINSGYSSVKYTSIHEIELNNNDSFTLLFHYETQFFDIIPDYFDHSGALSTSNFDVIVAFNVVGIPYEDDNIIGLRMKKTSEPAYELSAVFENDSDKVLYHLGSNTYQSASNIGLFNFIFNGEHKIEYHSGLSSNYIHFFRFLVYYFSTSSLRYSSYTFNNNLKNVNVAVAQTTDLQPLYDYFFIQLPNIGEYLPNSFIEETIEGSFWSNNTLYKSIVFRYATAYDGATGFTRSYIARGDTSSATLDNHSESLNGYHYLNGVYFVKANGETQPLYYQETSTGVGNSFTIFINSYIWANEYLKTIKINYMADNTSSSYFNNGLFAFYKGVSYYDFLSFYGNYTLNMGISTDVSTTSVITDVFYWLFLGANGLQPLLSFVILPGLTIGTFIMIPLTITIILFVVKLFKR